MKGEAVELNGAIHQSTRLRVMTLLISQSASDRVAFGFIQRVLGLTGGNLTVHLRKLEDAGYVNVTKEFVEAKPRTWVKATLEGRRAFAEYLGNLERILNMSL